MWPFNRFSIFWKIFCWFWLALLTMVFVSLVVWSIFRDSVSFHEADFRSGRLLHRLANVLEGDIENEKRHKAIRKILHRFHHQPPPFNKNKRKPKMSPVYLIDSQGKDLENKPIPESLGLLIRKSKKERKVFAATYRGQVFIGPKNVIIDDKRYQLFVEKNLGFFRLRVLHHLFYNLSPWVFISFLSVSFFLCLLLAWSFSRPLKKMRWVTHQLGQGRKVSAVDQMGGRTDEFYLLAQDFDQMSNKILKTVNTQKQLLSDVSHELRSPLARLSLAVGLLEKKSTDEQKKEIERVELECQRMEEMIQQLLKIAELGRGHSYEMDRQINLKSLLDDIIKNAKFEAQNLNVDIFLVMHHEVLLSGYYQLLYSAVENILRNALRHAANSSFINLEVDNEMNDLVISISDSGSGVPEKDLQAIFSPFFRTEPSRSRQDGGAGLGLAIAFKAVEIHDGTLSAENIYSNEQKITGLKVTIRIPAERCHWMH